MIDSVTSSAFVALRPPGHHALAEKPMGFCLFNNIAIAARYAEKSQGLQRILIIDWDVHHGNGTQASFYKDPGVCFVSLHQYPLWPLDSGWYEEDGEGDGLGYNINIPLPAGTGDRGYLKAWDTLLTPIALAYQPQLILVSAGYDAHQADPLADQCLSTNGFAEMSARVDDLARTNQAKVACFLEGGYNAGALSQSVLATIKVLNGDEAIEPGAARQLTCDRNPDDVDERIGELKKHFAKYWKCLR
jgi:acetoin utilization deacetylase AcuC-like enzyme